MAARNTKLTRAAGIVILTAAFAGCSMGTLSVKLPRYEPTQKVLWLEQNWLPEQRNWFHHADQGALTFDIPYEWLIALEQPSLSFSTPGLLGDATYLDRYGFIPGDADTVKQDLPVGFAHGGAMTTAAGSPWRNPQTKANMTGVGLTCAACHTGRFTYHNTTVLVDGAPALINLDKLRTGVGLALLYTRYVPFRFERFASRILGPGAGDAAKSELRGQLDQVLAVIKKVHALDDRVQSRSVEEGYARLDALNRIGNTVFALDLNQPDNYGGTSAPVHYPRIWNAPWFEWVQYNGSIEQPMGRNAGEALGIAAPVNLTDAKQGLFTSGVQFATLVELERQVAGDPPEATRGFSGLRSPEWPADILPPVDPELASKGAVLYRQLCQGCHLPPVTDPAFWASEHWLPPNSAGERYLDLQMIDIKQVGTDPAQAEDMQRRMVAIPASLGITTNDFGLALGQLIGKTADHWYDSQHIPAALRLKMNGNRENGVRAPLAYKARPLNGIWATPPYLHNGAVPTLYALLSPVAERPTRFNLGKREYDPENVGYRTEAIPGGFELNTQLRGNSNAGHEFADTPGKDGVIGRLLTPEERRALVEYLKTL